MKKASLLLVVGLALTVTLQSCLFQNDPVGPNLPPRITYASPEQLVIELRAEIDSVHFVIEARDGNLDELTYKYVLLDGAGQVDSLLHTGNSYIFRPLRGGFYHLQGRAYDRYNFDRRDWYVDVTEMHNDPPRIVWRSPAQDSFTVLIGDSVEFRLGVEDDHPQNLRYSYYAWGALAKHREPTSEFVYRFMQNGICDVKAVVWDGAYGDTTSWAVTVVGDPDTIPPSPIADLAGWTGDEPGTVSLQWTAPGDDGDQGTARYYLIRTKTIQILTESDWLHASPKTGAPAPAPAGSVETAVVNNLNPGTWLYVAVRAVDDFGNISPLGNCIRLLARGFDADGRVIDADTGEPLAGIFVSAEGVVCTTGVDGRYRLDNLPYYTNRVRARDELVPGDLGAYYDLSWPVPPLTSHFSLDLPLVPVLGLESTLWEDSYPGGFLEFLKYLTDTRGLNGRPTIFRRWNHYPVSVYNPPFMWEGVDLQALAAAAMESWESGSGLDLFAETDDPEAADVVINYDEVLDSKHRIEKIAFNPDGTPSKIAIWIFPKNTLSPMTIRGQMVFAHEFGHVLQLAHSTDYGHLMVGQTAPAYYVNGPTLDELRLLRVLHRFPFIFDTTVIQND